MHWINIHTSDLRSPEYIGSEPVQRATWLNVMCYCIEQENGGRIAGGATWKDRQWQQACGVTLAEVVDGGELVTMDGDDVVVWRYPAEKEAQVQRDRAIARENGKRGGRPKKPSRNPRETHEKPSGNPHGFSKKTQREPSGNPAETREKPSGNPAETREKPSGNPAETQAESGREGKGRVKERKEVPPYPPMGAGAATAANDDQTPGDLLHRAMADVEDRDSRAAQVCRPRSGFADWRITHPRVFVGRDEAQQWAALLDEYGPGPPDHAYRVLLEGDPQGRVYLSAVLEWLAKNYVKTEDT